MKKNKLSKKFKAQLSKEKWEEICPNMEYRVISGSEAHRLGIAPTGMTNLNSVTLASSGHTWSSMIHCAIYYRIDGVEIDQEPYIEIYESGSTQCILNGILHHADFTGRTEALNTEELIKIAISGVNTSILFNAKPTNNLGSLDELKLEGKIMSFEYALKQGMKKKISK